jgi:hypothetical protein
MRRTGNANATATASAGAPWFTILLVVGLIMRYAVVPGTTWQGVDVHYAGAFVIVAALIPLALLLAFAALVLMFGGAVALLNARDRRKARKVRASRLGR